MTIRLFFFLLVLTNLIFFAWAQGYFGATDDSREPQRLTQQFGAEKLRIVRDVTMPAANKEDLACRLVTGLTVTEAEALKTAVADIGGEAKIQPQTEPPLHLVLIGELANKATADKKSAELVRFGVPQHHIVSLRNGHFEIIFGSFPTEAAARELLQNLNTRGIKSARLDAREQSTVKARIVTRAAAATLLLHLPKLIESIDDAAIVECAA